MVCNPVLSYSAAGSLGVWFQQNVTFLTLFFSIFQRDEEVRQKEESKRVEEERQRVKRERKERDEKEAAERETRAKERASQIDQAKSVTHMRAHTHKHMLNNIILSVCVSVCVCVFVCDRTYQKQQESGYRDQEQHQPVSLLCGTMCDFYALHKMLL